MGSSSKSTLSLSWSIAPLMEHLRMEHPRINGYLPDPSCGASQQTQTANVKSIAEAEEPQKKRKRTLVRKSAATVLSSPESAASGDDSEESDFVAGDDSESEDNDMDVDASEEDSPLPAAKKPPPVSLIISIIRSKSEPRTESLIILKRLRRKAASQDMFSRIVG